MAQTLYDEEKMFMINKFIQIRSWIELINPLRYGKSFYSSSSGHYIPNDDPQIIISSIKLALHDYSR
ncbi:MAG TPA: hypothetical protein DEG92_03030 [Rikenellaceae bacterium]|nr:hypothetical protein [Rikenellaceae bacterium]